MIGGFLPILFQLFLLYTMSVTVLIDGSIKGNREVCVAGSSPGGLAGARRERELDARERRITRARFNCEHLLPTQATSEFPVLFKTAISYQYSKIYRVSLSYYHGKFHSITF